MKDAFGGPYEGAFRVRRGCVRGAFASVMEGVCGNVMGAVGKCLVRCGSGREGGCVRFERSGAICVPHVCTKEPAEAKGGASSSKIDGSEGPSLWGERARTQTNAVAITACFIVFWFRFLLGDSALTAPTRTAPSAAHLARTGIGSGVPGHQRPDRIAPVHRVATGRAPEPPTPHRIAIAAGAAVSPRRSDRLTGDENVVSGGLPRLDGRDWSGVGTATSTSWTPGSSTRPATDRESELDEVAGDEALGLDADCADAVGAVAADLSSVVHDEDQ